MGDSLAVRKLYLRVEERMQTLLKTFEHPSKELSLVSFANPDFVEAGYHDLKAITKDEYLDFLKLTGDFLAEQKTGRLLADFSSLKSFPLELKACAINNFRRLIADRIPYMLLAIVVTRESPIDFMLDAAIEVARPLSRKFVDGHIFTKKTEALSWLVEYPIESLGSRRQVSSGSRVPH